MKRKSFNGFLTDYVKEMNSSHSFSLAKNELESSNNARLKYIFGFYLLFSESAIKVLLTNSDKYPILYKQYLYYVEKYPNIDLKMLDKYVDKLDDFDELKKLYQSYHRLVLDRDNGLKKQYRMKILSIQKEKNITNYRIYTSLKLNVGNTNDFLKNDNLNKLSLKKIQKIYEYCIQK